MSAKPDLMNSLSQLSEMLTKESSGSRSLPGWWNSFQFHETLSFDPNDMINFARSAMFTSSLVHGGVVNEKLFAVHVDSVKRELSEYLDDLSSKFGDMRLVYKSPKHHFLVSKVAAIQIDAGVKPDTIWVNPETAVGMTVISFNEGEIFKIEEVFNEFKDEQVAT